MKAWIVFSIVFFSPRILSDLKLHNLLIVWNVGQGQWLTRVTNEVCDHYDFGGEKLPLLAVQKFCSEKINHLHLSHWDLDHWGGLPKLRTRVNHLCHDPWPEHLLNKKIKPWIDEIPICESVQKPWYRPGSEWVQSKKTKSNDMSQVYISSGDFLIPGDSTQKMEKIWSHLLALQPIRILILGHHGSRTSTSNLLLDRLPRLKLAISTARKKRFGHPHQEVIDRLARHHVPMIRTEDWGSLGFEL